MLTMNDTSLEIRAKCFEAETQRDHRDASRMYSQNFEIVNSEETLLTHSIIDTLVKVGSFYPHYTTATKLFSASE